MTKNIDMLRPVQDKSPNICMQKINKSDTTVNICENAGDSHRIYAVCILING